MRSGKRRSRTRRQPLVFGAALAVALGLIQMGTASAQAPTPPNLQVTKSSSLGGDFDGNDPVTYTITVTNVGGTEAEDVVVQDDLPPGMDAPGPFPTLAGDPCTVTSGVVVGGIPQASVRCGPVSVAAGESAVVEIETDTAGLCGRIVNAVEVEASNEPAELAADNRAQAVDQGPECNPDISLDVAASPGEGRVGAKIRYTYTVTNTGETTLYGITVRDDRLGSIGIIDGFSLRPGGTDRFKATATLGSSPITNEATATGEDIAGHEVSASDSVTVAVVSAGGTSGGDDETGGAGGTPFTGVGSGGVGVLALLLVALGAVLVALTGRSKAIG